ncbi:MAG: IclR family transcriptional regulator [Actinobacteria bacterium]|nr:IclR family transcriptional regulator [Actinomycetota bacterium]
MASKAEAAEKPTYPIGSVDSALRLLLLVGEHKQLRIADAAEELGVARSTAHRLMQMLQFHGFVKQDEDSRAYRAGPVLFNMGLQVVRNLDIRRHARPAIEATAAELGETVLLFVLQQDGHIACIDGVESEKWLRIGNRIGAVLPAHQTACGLALLAEYEPEQLNQIYPEHHLANGDGAAITWKEFEKRLKATRKLGYAVQKGELEADVSAVGAAIRDERGHASFAVSIAIPTSRLGSDSGRKLGEAAIACAGRITAELPW